VVFIGIISDVQDTVVELGSAVRENSSRVELPGFSIDSDGDWLLVDGIGQISTVSLFDISEGLDFEVSSLNFAFSVSGGVFVGRFGGDTVVDDVLESVVHQTSVASHISVAL